MRTDTATGGDPAGSSGAEGRDSTHTVGDAVWLRRPSSCCADRLQPGVVSSVPSLHIVDVGRTPWYVVDARHRSESDS